MRVSTYFISNDTKTILMKKSRIKKKLTWHLKVLPDYVVPNQDFELLIEVDLPDAAWEVTSIETHVDHEKKQIVIVANAQRRPGMAAQVITHAVETIIASVPAKGTWTVVLNVEIVGNIEAKE